MFCNNLDVRLFCLLGQESGNRFILTILDLCTHYPEAIRLKQHTAADVAQALGTVFSRFGFPQEILSDQGSDFMSELMQVFLNEFSVHHIGLARTTRSLIEPASALMVRLRP